MRPQPQNETHDRLGRLEKTTDRLDGALRAKDRDDAVRFTLLTERLEVLTTIVKESSTNVKEQMKDIKDDTKKLANDIAWISIAWKVFAGLLAVVGVAAALLKAIHVIP